MTEFARQTGLSPADTVPRRYLWTDAFAVCNFFELNAKTVWRLLELAYRCNVCRRCAQVCPVGIDNALLAREIRKLFSQELGIAPKELLQKGTRQHLQVGSSTGMNPAGLKDAIEVQEELIFEKTGRKIKIPIDRKGAAAPKADASVTRHAAECQP